MKKKCLFCNTIIKINPDGSETKCKRCKSIALIVNADFKLPDHDPNITEAKVKILKTENKIRSEIEEDSRFFMYYPHTNEELLKVFTKAMVDALLKILDNKKLNGAERQRINRMRKIVNKIREKLILADIINGFESPAQKRK